jgi:hypothetical protein
MPEGFGMSANQTINADYDPDFGWQFAFDDYAIGVSYYGGGIPTLGWTVWVDGSQSSSHGDDLGEAITEALFIQRSYIEAEREARERTEAA